MFSNRRQVEIVGKMAREGFHCVKVTLERKDLKELRANHVCIRGTIIQAEEIANTKALG